MIFIEIKNDPEGGDGDCVFGPPCNEKYILSFIFLWGGSKIQNKQCKITFFEWFYPGFCLGAQAHVWPK
jgi:hypothetical protein